MSSILHSGNYHALHGRIMLGGCGQCVQNISTITSFIFSFIIFDIAGAYSDIDKYKLERKRERNRIAATKCR